MRRDSPAIHWCILASLVALNLLVIAPFLATDFSPQVWNNDYTYIGMSRMFRDRPWSWNSLQYGGAPFHYLYPPLFHLLVMCLPVRSLGRAYHLSAGAGYALAPAAFYVAAYQIFRSRVLAAALALVQSFSPTLLYSLVPAFRGLARSYHYGPWNFVALIASNEAAHTLALALILLVLAAAWRDRWVLASVCAAAVFLLNWAGVIGLLMVLAAVAIARSRELGMRSAALRVASVAGVGYGLAAFWITPDCIYTTKLLDRVMLRHIQPSTPWNGTTWIVLAGAAVLVAIGLWPRTNTAVAFVLALLAIAGAVVICYSATGNYLLPLPHRYVQEFNVGLVLAVGCVAAAAEKRRRALGGLVLLVSAVPAIPFLMGAWEVQPRSWNPRQSSAFQISDWLARNAGGSRVVVAGELEGALNIWTDVPQVGGSAQGISHYLVLAAHRQVALGCGAPDTATRIAELWLRALDVRYLVVHGARSSEHFHWFVQPERFASLPVAWTNGAGDTIYRLPPPEEYPAVVVDLAQMKQLGRLRSTDDLQFLESYVAWAHGKREARIHWLSPGRAEIRADLGPQEAVLVKVNSDPGWSSSRGAVGADPIGFVLVTGAGGSPAFNLRFGTSWSVWLGRAITLATILLLVARVPLWITAAAALVPAIAAYGVLVVRTPPSVAVAEDTFRRVRPPLINPAGIVDGVTLAQPPLARGSVISLFGDGFGAAQNTVHVWIGSRQAAILYHGLNQLNVTLPADAPPVVDVSVEVNGCRGNAFSIVTR